MSLYDASADDYIRVNAWERDIREKAGEAHDLMVTKPAEASVVLAAIVAICNQWDELIVRRADERAERVEEPYGDAWVPEFNRSQQ